MADAPEASGEVSLTPAFSNANQRNPVAKEILRELVAPLPDEGRTSIDSPAEQLLGALLGNLASEPPGASQAAEGALTILALTIAEKRKLDLVWASSSDLGANRRIPGDRTLGDWLCQELLQSKNIPSTQGPFQSSSFRGGYTSEQVRNDGLRRFIAWYSAEERTFADLKSFATHLGGEFAARAVDLPDLPQIAAARLTFLRFRLFQERLLQNGSGGAFEQYLLAGLLGQELSASGTGLRIQTKNVGANDAATHSGGDIEVRHGQVLLRAYEVTANDWRSKLSQLSSSASAGLDEVTVVANGVAATSGEQLQDAFGAKSEEVGIDAAIVDLPNMLDVVASRISRHARSEAIVFLYSCLKRWHRREPDLVHRLVDSLRQLDLIVEGVPPIAAADQAMDAESPLSQVRALLDELGAIGEPALPDALRTLADSLETTLRTDSCPQ